VFNLNINKVNKHEEVKIDVLRNGQSINLGMSQNLKCLLITSKLVNAAVMINENRRVYWNPFAGFVSMDEFTSNLCDNAHSVNCQSTRVGISTRAKQAKKVPNGVDDYSLMTVDWTHLSFINRNVLSNVFNISASFNFAVTVFSKPSTSQGKVVMNADGSYKVAPALDFSRPEEVVHAVFEDAMPKNCRTARLHVLVKAAPILESDNGGDVLNALLTCYLSYNDVVHLRAASLAIGEAKDSAWKILNLIPNGLFTFWGEVVGVSVCPVPGFAISQTFSFPVSTFEISVVDMVYMRIFKQVGSVNWDEGSEVINSRTVKKFGKTERAKILGSYNSAVGIRFNSSKFSSRSVTSNSTGFDLTWSMSSVPEAQINEINLKVKGFGLYDYLMKTIANVVEISSSMEESSLLYNSSFSISDFQPFSIPRVISTN